MCDPVTIGLMVGGMGVNALGQRKQQKSMERAQQQKLLDDSARSQVEFMANMNRDRQIFGAKQESGRRAMSRDKDRLRALDMAMQSKDEIAKDMEDMDTAAGERVADAKTAIQNTENAGLQSVGSGVAGRVSSKHTTGNKAAKTSSKGKAMKRAKSKANVSAFSDIGLDNVKAVTDAGVNSSMMKSSIERRRAIDALLEQAAINQAITENRVAPDTVRVYDPTSRSGQLLSAFGNGLSTYGAYGGGFGGFGGKTATGGGSEFVNFRGR